MSENAQKEHKPDFIGLKKRFDDHLTPGQRAELRTASSPDDLAFIPAYYHLIRPFITQKRWSRRRWSQVVYLLPYASHSETSPPLGGLLAKAGVREARLFQIIRSEYPNELIQLRRVLQQAKSAVNWQQLGEQLFFWNSDQKRRLLEDFYLSKK